MKARIRLVEIGAIWIGAPLSPFALDTVFFGRAEAAQGLQRGFDCGDFEIVEEELGSFHLVANLDQRQSQQLTEIDIAQERQIPKPLAFSTGLGHFVRPHV
jgi:hypothetical protein